MKEAVQTLKRQRVRMMLVNLAYFIVLLILGVSMMGEGLRKGGS